MPQISQSLDATRPTKWKVKADEHDTDLRNFASIQKDMDQVLPGLLTTAQASPKSVASGLAVYRNLNALYDVMVRLEQTAEIAGRDDLPGLQDALTRLETVRGDLAEKLTALSAQQEAVVAHAQRVLAEQQAAAAAPKHIVADDAAPAKKKTPAKNSPAKNSPAKKSPAKKPSAATQ